MPFVAILLAHLKMPIDEIYKAILAVDETKLSEPHIKTFQMCAPERAEVGHSLKQPAIFLAH